jgi:hypothetical protein
MLPATNKEFSMCVNNHEIGFDLETVAKEFHEIKHLLMRLNESVAKIAESMKRCEQQLAQQK